MSNPIPELNEDEISEVINRIAKRVSPKYRFGYHSIDDMIQQGAMLGWKVIAEGKFTYGPAHTKEEIVRRLGAFMATHMRNRLDNFRRDFSCRYANKDNKYNSSKYNIMHPVKMGDGMDHSFFQTRDRDRINKEESIKYIRSQLDTSMVKDFLKIQAGVSIPSKRRDDLLLRIREINET